MENTINIPLYTNYQKTFKIKEYIFNNKIVALKPDINSVISNFKYNPIYLKLNIAKILIQW